ncbi:MAG: site-specific integrase [Lachnospiraceae bacterium]|nr:site-specific integrase [Lachnospiraceae bacterium]
MIKTEKYITEKKKEATRLVIIASRNKTPEALNADDVRVKLNNIISYVESAYNAMRGREIPKGWLSETIDAFYREESYKTSAGATFFQLYDEYLAATDIEHTSASRKMCYEVQRKSLVRFQNFKRLTQPNFNLTIEGFGITVLREYEDFLRNEHIYIHTFPQILKGAPLQLNLRQKSQNAVSNRFKYIRSIYNWAIKTGRLQINPMQGFTVAQEIYGTPFYLTIEERKILEDFDFSHDPRLGIHRDLFVFHCCVGCRVSDLISFTWDNIVGNQLHYIARKTKEGRPITIQVPLNSTAQRILEKYKDTPGDHLFPECAYISYNKDIKRMLKEAGIHRHVVVIDQKTRESVSRPIYEVASTHMARRTFIGNVYKKFKDQNMVSALTGHKPGSTAFVRYREIDDDMKQEMVDAID